MEKERVFELLKERSILIRNEVERGKISPKVAASFAVTFYEGLDSEYDEKQMIILMKKMMEFFNNTIENIPKLQEEGRTTEILNDLNSIKNLGERIYKKSFPIVKQSEDIIFKDIESYIPILRDIKKDLISSEDEKPKFFKKNWDLKIIENLERLSKIENGLKNLLDLQKKEINKIREISEKNFEEIKESLKRIVFETDSGIGSTLAIVDIEDVIEDEENLKIFIYNDMILPLCKFFQEKQDKILN
ncbi:MAG: hypothetical protein ACRCZ9_03065 [Fusobacteriaceae bacterium]